MLIGLNNTDMCSPALTRDLEEKLADARQKLMLTRPNSVLALANFISLVAYVVQKANAAPLDVSRPPKDAKNTVITPEIPSSSIGREGK